MRLIQFDKPGRGPDTKPRKIKTHCKRGHERPPEDRGKTCRKCKSDLGKAQRKDASVKSQENAQLK